MPCSDSPGTTHFACDCVLERQRELEAKVSTIRRELLERIILAAIDHGLRCEAQGNPEGLVALGKFERWLRSLLPAETKPEAKEPVCACGHRASEHDIECNYAHEDGCCRFVEDAP